MSEHNQLAPYHPAGVERADSRQLATPYYDGPPIQTLWPEHPLREYCRILFKRRWTVLTIVLVLTTLVTIATFRMTPIYSATAKVEIAPEQPDMQSLNEMFRYYPTDEYFLRTQIKVLQSDTLALKTIEDLQLQKHPDFASQGKSWRQLVSSSRDKAETILVERFHSRLQVELLRISRLVEIRFESPNPRLAADVTNTLVRNYIDYNFRRKYQTTTKASEWMTEQLDELKAKVERSQQALVDYERRHQIVNLDEKQNLVTQRMVDVSREFTLAQADRIQKESLHKMARGGDLQKVSAVAQNQLIQRLSERYIELSTQMSEVNTQFGPNYPKFVRLQNQLTELRNLIEKEETKVLHSLQADYRAALEREQLLLAAVQAQKAEASRLSELLIQYDILKREAQSNQQLYDGLLKRLKEAGISAGLRASNIHLVDPARIPVEPVRPRKALNLALSLLVGLVLGVMVALVQEHLDNTVKTPEEVEQVAAIPSLGLIPAQISPNGSRRRRRRLAAGRQEWALPAEPVELVSLQSPKSAIAESYRSLRTAVLLSASARPPQVLLVSSPQPAEGKTTVVTNLAVLLAQLGGPVILVDSDMRKPRIHKIFGLSNERGLSTYLTGTDQLEQTIVPIESVPHLSVMTCGPLPPNPAELLSSTIMQEMVAQLRPRFTHILLDSPPIIHVTDAVILSSLSDGVILVAQGGVTTREALKRARKILHHVNGKLLGIVLNNVDVRSSDYSYYYGGRYYYYYDSAEPMKEKSSAEVPLAPMQSGNPPQEGGGTTT